jgi:Polyketide cyclase / dehydrase and lipid transport
MSSNDYHFVTHWRVDGTLEEVSDVLGNATDLTRWWPSVYLGVREIEPGGPDGVGRVVELHTKGWLPYTLHWFFRLVESQRPHGFSIEAWGDFDGRGVWTFEQDGGAVNITYDWRIRAEKPLLRYLSFLVKPIFSANHRWAMARGEESLRAELGRRAGVGQQSAGHVS